MKIKKPNPWAWIPSLYFIEGLPYIVVMVISGIMYKRLGVSNTDLALYTSWLYLPWVIKPFWSPLVDMFRTKRFWIVSMQLIIGAGLAGVALTIPTSNFFQYSLAFLWLVAFSSATHDIAADGFYMLGLEKHEQAFFVGIRSTFYRFAMITGQGILVIFAGYFESTTGLNTVEVEVNTILTPAKEQSLTPAQFPVSENDNGELKLVVSNKKVNISVENTAQSDLIAQAKTWNTQNNFYQVEEVAQKITDKNEETAWQTYVSKPLGNFLKSNFGTEKKENTTVQIGSTGWVYFHLSKAPPTGEKVVVNLSSSTGDKSITLKEGTRFEFDETNWNRPAIAIFQLDPKLKTTSQATFTATSGNIPLAWSVTFFLLAGLLIVAFVYHNFSLPTPDSDKVFQSGANNNPLKDFVSTFVLFFKKDKIIPIIGFLLFYRFGEAQLAKLASPFLLDAKTAGGLGLTTGEVGIVYGTIGLVFLTLGGILGGWVISKNGLKYWLWWMLLSINLPNAVYIFLAYTTPTSFITISMMVAIEQLGYGFGFTAYMMFMIYVSEGAHKTAHFAITTGFMALGMMIPGMFSGWLQDLIGYPNFFTWVLISAIPGFLVAFTVPIDKDFGKKIEVEES